jgi:hypothetical protein
VFSSRVRTVETNDLVLDQQNDNIKDYNGRFKSRKAIFSNGRIQKLVKRRIILILTSSKVKDFIQQQKSDQTMLDFVDKLKNNLDKQNLMIEMNLGNL